MRKSEYKTVVYIEDELELIDLLSLILKNDRIIVEPALRGRDGLELVRQIKPDLVLLDLMLPDMEGWDVYEAMQQDVSLKDIPVIVITVRTEGLMAGVWPQTQQLAGYVVKPFTVQDLRREIHHVLCLSPE